MSARGNPLQRFLSSTIGLKVVMALTGLLLAGFLLEHMFGHLQVVTVGQDGYNAYAHFLQSLGPAKWVARLGLLGLLVAHVASAIALKKRNDAARPHRYAALKAQRSTLYGRVMLVSGIVLAVYLVYHLMHFTLGWVTAPGFGELDAQGRHDIYSVFVQSFRNPVIATVYIVASVFVAMHLAHALSSMFRTLGLSVGRYRSIFDRLGPVVGWVVGVGFLVPPLLIMLGIAGD